MPIHAMSEKRVSEEDLVSFTAKSCTPIAIVGIGFRGPAEANNVNKLMEMIVNGREAWSPIPAKRWNNEAFYHPDNARHGSINVEGGHFLEEDVSVFDAPFFNMTGDEAAAMDPQQRLLLEVTYEGLENAGIPLSKIAGTNTSCFVGSFSADYTDLLLRDPECVPMYQCTNAGQSRAMTANRLSYFFDLKGPSVIVDTACSGSLVALHLACQSLQTGDATMAIAAGVNLILSHEFMSTMSMMRFLSPDGRCHTFDEKANGYARGEAVGCLILKPLAKALHDGDTVRAVIRGTGSNQDGRTAGIALPNRVAQENLIRSVYARTGLDPLQTDFVEAHGTGTQAGDPLETKAISEVFGAGRPADKPVRIGSIKTNVGHLEGASGVAGVIKAVLMLENRMFFPNRNFDKINPHIHIDEWNLKIQLATEPWEATGPRRISVNSFGYGGSNAHVIIEEAQSYLTGTGSDAAQPSLGVRREPEKTNIPSSSSKPPRVYLLSGFDEASCARQMQSLRMYILQRKKESIGARFLDNLAFTVNERRTLFPWKAAVVGSTVEDLEASLSQRMKARSSIQKPRVGYVFTGQGAQWPGMGQELFQVYPIFQCSISNIDRYLTDIGCKFSVKEEIMKPSQESNLSHPCLSQTVCTALQIALVDLLRSWGIYPDSVTGHSSGEIAAAYAAGALSMKDAMSVAYHRGVVAGQLLDDSFKGAMIAVGLSIEETRIYLGQLPPTQLIVVACINSPSSVTVSGNEESIEMLAQMLRDQSIFWRRLDVGVAYHSPQMEIVAELYSELIDHVQVLESTESEESCIGSPAPRFFSSVSGTLLPTHHLSYDYWVSNLTGQVKFADSLKALCFETQGQRSRSMGSNRTKRFKSAQKPSVDCLIEIGPHSALAGPVRQIIRADTKLSSGDIAYVSILTRNANAVTTVANAVATLASLNYPVNFGAINRPTQPVGQGRLDVLVDLPPYSWDHTRSYWAEPRLSKMYRNRPTPRLDLLGAPDNMACPTEPRWRNHLRTSELPWLLDHKIQGSIIFPAAGYLTMAIEAAKQMTKTNEDSPTYLLQEVEIKSALVLSETSAVEMMVSLSKPQHHHSHLFNFRIYSISTENRWTEHCNGWVGRQKSCGASKGGAEEADDYVMVPLGTEVHGVSVIDIKSFYEKLQNSGLEYGPCFTNLTEARVTQDGSCFAEITVPDTKSVMPASFQHDFLIHPCTLDSIFHTILAALPAGKGVEKGPVIPVSIEEMVVSARLNRLPGEQLSTCTHVRPASGKDATACIVVMDCNDKKFEMEPSLSIRGLRCARLSRLENSLSPKEETDMIYHIEWKPDVSFLESKNGSALLTSGEPREEPQGLVEKEYWAAEFIRNALKEISPKEAMRLDLSHRRLWCYLQDVLERYDKDNLPLSHKGDTESDHIGYLLKTVGSNLVNIIRNQVDYPTVIEDENSLLEYWNMFATDASYQAAAHYIELIGHKKPDISIIEFGVGTGQISEIFLKRLMKPDETSRFAKYTFAHESSSVVEQASTQLQPWSDRVECKLLDLRTQFAQQGVEKGSFDVIILPHGLCTARCEQDALSKIHDLLSPSGCLIAVNPFDPKESVLKSLLFGALHCLSADEFCLGQGGWTEGQWIEILNAAKFTGVNIFAEQGSLKSHQFIVARKTQTELLTPRIVIIDENKSDNTANELVDRIRKVSSKVTLADISNVDPRGQICLVLDTAESSLLVNPDQATLEKIKLVFMHSAGVLWVTRGGTIDPVNPDAGLVSGFARTARAESGVKSIVTFDLDGQNCLPEKKAAEVIFNLLFTRMLRKNADSDTEYAERGGLTLIPRVVENLLANETMASIDDTECVSTQPFEEFDHPLRLSRKGDALDFVTDRKPLEIPSDYVGIKVRSFSLSQGDIWKDLEYWGQDDTAGVECSGIVYCVGSEVQGYSVGDRVACLGSGTARTFYHGRASSFQKVRDDMTFDVASCIPLAYTMGLYAVNDVAAVEKNETALVYNAGSHLGQAIVDVCLLKHARVFALVQTPHEKDLLVSAYGPPAEQIFRLGEVDIVKCLLRLTDGKKANVVFTIDASEEIDPRSCTASFGRVVQLKTDTAKGHGWSCPQNMTMSITNISEFCRERNVLVADLWLKVARLFLDRQLHGPASMKSYRLPSVHEAIGALSTEQHVVVSAAPSDMVKVSIPKSPQSLFHDHASYLLVGGLGGIGQQIALWMARNGAKSLIFINRSGVAKGQAKATVKDLMESGVQVTIRACDMSKGAEVGRVFDDLSKCAPPIRGVIQAAMVLKDIHIENMQLEDYADVIGPKHRGTWNLHHTLPSDLDFFVMLSSISGVIGNATQAAYASACAFQDSFAAYRNRRGQTAVSLDLGVITDAGYLAENKELAKNMKRQGFHGTNTETLLSLIQVALSHPRMTMSQMITGLGRWKEGESLGNFDEALFAHFRHKFGSPGQVSGSPLESLKADLNAARTTEQAAAVICEMISNKLASHLSIPVENIDPSNRVSEYGVDSHVAVDLRDWLSRSMACTIPILEILAKSLTDLSFKVASEIKRDDEG